MVFLEVFIYLVERERVFFRAAADMMVELRLGPPLRAAALALLSGVAVHVRLFGVRRYGAQVDQFDPYHHLRAAGLVEAAAAGGGAGRRLGDWFDARAWYPLGQPAGGSAGASPGLVHSARAVLRLANALVSPLPFFGPADPADGFRLLDVCVYLPPAAAVAAVLLTYALAREARTPPTPFPSPHAPGTQTTAALARASAPPGGPFSATRAARFADDAVPLAAAGLVAVAPGFVLKSVAGLYDSECLGTPAVLAVGLLWLRAVNRGSTGWAAAAALAFAYLASVWDVGAAFVAAVVGLHVLALCAGGRFSDRLYVACTSAFPLAAVAAAPFLAGWGRPQQRWQGLAAVGVLAVVVAACATAQILGQHWWAGRLPAAVWSAGVVGPAVGAAALAVLGLGAWQAAAAVSAAAQAAPALAVVASSVSEHRPTTWAQFFVDLHLAALLFPAGLHYCVHAPTDGRVLFAVFGMAAALATACAASSMPLLAPAACLVSGVALGEHVATQLGLIALAAETLSDGPDDDDDVGGGGGGGGADGGGAAPQTPNLSRKKLARLENAKKRRAEERSAQGFQLVLSGFLLIGVAFALVLYAWHCTWVASEMYSTPSIVVPARRNDGAQVAFDDYREAYAWLRANSASDAKVLSWWDYGYQLNALANRTTLVDNAAPSGGGGDPSTAAARSRLVATVGHVMVSNEVRAHALLRSLDVDYVMVVFGGVTGYAGDDLSNFLWMAKTAAAEFPDEVRVADYFPKRRKGARGGRRKFTVGKKAPRAVTDSLLYRLSYAKFGRMQTDVDKPRGWDRVRRTELGRAVDGLAHFEEVLTTEHWLVRLYRVKPLDNSY